MQGERVGTEDRPGSGLMVRLVAPAAFLWLLFCGIGWIDSGARHTPTDAGFAVSVKWGLLAGAPAFIAAVVVFCWQVARLIRGTGASWSALVFSAGAIFGGLVMDLMVWDLYLSRLYPPAFAHGRRLHHHAKLLAARACRGAGWVSARVPVLDVSAGDRAAIAAQWRENGSKEHASIAAFAHLTIDLMAVGAPATLVAAAQRASLDEVHHATACYGVARKLDGQDESPAPFPQAQTRRTLAVHRPIALAQIAVDALADGALNEGIASRILARLSRRASTPELARALAQMATDEARHARDSWDVIEWCLASGGDVVRRALVRARDTMPEELGSPLPPAARGGGWEAWGIQGVALEVSEYAVVRRHAQRRLDALLGTHEAAARKTAA